MATQTTANAHTFEMIYDISEDKITEEIDDEGNVINTTTEKIYIKKGVTEKWRCLNLSNITDIKVIRDDDSKLYRNRVQVYHKPSGSWISIKGTFDSVCQLIERTDNKIGY